MIQLRAYQQNLVEKSRNAFRAGHRRQVLVAPPRSGKTYTFVFMATSAAQKGMRVLVMAHREALIEQTAASFDAVGVEVGLIMAGRNGNNLPIQIGMMGTVARRLDRIHPPNLIIIDEAHRALGATYRKILDAFPCARVLLFTATPARTDGRGLGAVADILIQGPQPRELIAAGNICAPRIFTPPLDVDLSSIRKVSGDYDMRAQATLLDKATIIGDVMEHYRTYADGKSFVAFCAGIDHAAHLAQQFTESGIPTRSIDGTNNRAERNEIMRALRDGSIRGITSVDLISEGVDLPSVHATIHLRRTASLIIYIQQTFRSLTPEAGKTHGVILDHVGNFDRFGWPDADREWTLDDAHNHNKRAVEARISVRRCHVCFANFLPHLDHCPHCGAVAERESRVLEERDGELVEITRDQARAEKISSAPYLSALQMCETPQEIKQMAKYRGYKSTWSIRMVMERFEVDKYEAARLLGYRPAAADWIPE